jgi:hypothetical protein
MDRWTFRSYVENGVDQVQLWYDQQVTNVRTEFDNIVKYLRDAPLEDWEPPDFKFLQGKLSVLGELRVIEETKPKTHYRVLGFMDESAMEFTMLAAARKTRYFSYNDIGPIALWSSPHLNRTQSH